MLPVLMIVAALSVPSPAQSLGETAKKAEEERKANAGKGIRIELAEIPGEPLRIIRLDKPTIEHYIKARIAMAQMWNRDERLFVRLRAATSTARTTREFSAALAGEPQVAALLEMYGYTPESFISMELSISQAERLTEGGFDLESLTDVERANYEFMGRNMVWMGVLRGRVHKAEAGFTIWR